MDEMFALRFALEKKMDLRDVKDPALRHLPDVEARLGGFLIRNYNIASSNGYNNFPISKPNKRGFPLQLSTILFQLIHLPPSLYQTKK
jgi:hypothetical protein